MIINADTDLIKQNLREEFDDAVQFLIEVEIIHLSRREKDFITGQAKLEFHGTVSMHAIGKMVLVELVLITE